MMTSGLKIEDKESFPGQWFTEGRSERHGPQSCHKGLERTAARRSMDLRLKEGPLATCRTEMMQQFDKPVMQDWIIRLIKIVKGIDYERIAPLILKKPAALSL